MFSCAFFIFEYRVLGLFVLRLRVGFSRCLWLNYIRFFRLRFRDLRGFRFVYTVVEKLFFLRRVSIWEVLSGD